jgi:hypothetical protein
VGKWQVRGVVLAQVLLERVVLGQVLFLGLWRSCKEQRHWLLF